MVRGKSRDRVAHLWAWSVVFADYARGQLFLRGLPQLHELPADLAADVIFALAVEQAGPGTLSKIDKALREPYWLTEESWGLGPSAEEGLSAMEDMFPAAATPGT